MTSLIAQLPVEGKNHPKEYPPLVKVTRTHVTTGEAAYYLNRAAQTLRMWACFETGPIRPIRVYGRLGWAVTDIRRVLGLP